MKSPLLAVTFTTLAIPALAGGVAEQPAPVPVPVPPAPAQDWTGPYVGFQIDLVRGEFDGDRLGVGTPTQPYDLDGLLYGPFIGYRRDLGQFVIGGEIDYMIGELDYDDGFETGTADVNHLIRAGIELGFDAGDVLVYGTGGWADIDMSAPGGDFSGDGYFFGIGADYRVSERVTVGVELLQHQFDDLDGAVGPSEMDLTTLGINAAFNF